MRKWLVLSIPVLAALITVILVGCLQPAPSGAQAQAQDTQQPAEKEASGGGVPIDWESFYHKSLHATGEGMRYWYEKEDGFMQITGIPYADGEDCINDAQR